MSAPASPALRLTGARVARFPTAADPRSALATDSGTAEFASGTDLRALLLPLAALEQAYGQIDADAAVKSFAAGTVDAQ